MENIKKALDVLDNVKVFWSPSQIQEIELAITALNKQLKIIKVLEDMENTNDYDIRLVSDVKDLLKEFLID